MAKQHTVQRRHISNGKYNNTTNTTEITSSLTVAKRPCDCFVGQFWPNIPRRQILRTL